MSLLYRRDGGAWIAAERGEYRDERALHDLLVDEPAILPTDDLEEAGDWFAIGYETALGSGYADAIFCSTEGLLTICEVKPRRNSEIRREVAAQASSYAAYLEGMGIEGFERQVVRPFLRRRELAHLLDEPLTAAAGKLSGIEIDGESFVENLEGVLREGNFRILIVVDEAHPQLRRSVAYINRHATFALYLVEVEVYRSGDGIHEILHPKMLDVTTDAKRRATVSRIDRTPEDFLDEAIDADPASEDALRKLYDRLLDLERDGLIHLESGVGRTASLKVKVGGTTKSIVWIWASGNVSFPRYPLQDLGVDPDQVQAWIERIATVSGAPAAKWELHRHEPRVVPPGTLARPEVVEVLLDVVEEAARTALEETST